MGIIGGLSAANLAMGLVKDLREIDKFVDEAAYKLKIAEVGYIPADAKTSLSDASSKLIEKGGENPKIGTVIRGKRQR